MTRQTLTLCATFLTCCQLSCLQVGVERAEADVQVGKAEGNGVSVEVSEGLASVREISEGGVVLWGQAPVLEVNMTSQSARSITLTVRNAMPDAILTIDGAEIDRQNELSTQHTWNLALESGRTHALRIGPPIARAGDKETPWRFVVYADVQEAIEHVQDLYEEMRRDEAIEFGLISGDLTETGTPEELERFQRELETLPFPVFATLGNHELGTSETLFHEYFGRGNYHFGYRGARFTMLDSASATIAPQVYPWLEEWLERAGEEAHLVVMHIPVLDTSGKRSGAFASRQEANQLLDMMATGGVDLAVYGHVHTYDRYTHSGIPAIISGGGGSIPMQFDGVGRHFLTIDVDPGINRFTPGLVRVYPESL